MCKDKKILAIIPARGGSKGLPGKNIKDLCGKPLICYSIDIAREIVDDGDICVSTDDSQIIQVVENYGLKVPFVRPEVLATDTASSFEVIKHALEYYITQGKSYDIILLLQPTSPLRRVSHVKDAISLYRDDIDMVVSVKNSHSASVLCNEDENGYLRLTLNHSANRRQDMPIYYEYNGAIYVINVKSFLKAQNLSFAKCKKYVMDDMFSIDIDSTIDFQYAEFLVKHYLFF